MEVRKDAFYLAWIA